MESEKLRAILEGIPNLPPMPIIITKILSMINEEDSNISEISSLVSNDVALTSKLLGLVNSAYFALPLKVTTVSNAMVLLGFGKVKDLILSMSIKPIMPSTGEKKIWEHSIRCAVGCEIIAKNLNENNADEAFTLGLLHDIGKTIIEVINPNASKEIDKLILEGKDINEAENSLFGFTHSEIGHELALMWNLPPIIQEAIRFHHFPLETGGPSIVNVVYVADRLTQENIITPVVEPYLSNFLTFEVEDTESLREEILEKSQIIINAFS